jgi:hypothetical protein
MQAIIFHSKFGFNQCGRAHYKDILIFQSFFTYFCDQIQRALKFKQCVNLNGFGFFWNTLWSG